MSCLKKVIDTVKTECGKSFTNAVLWSDGICAGSTMKDTMAKSQWMT